MAQIIDGKKISAQIREELKLKVADLTEKGCRPGLAVIIVGEDAASQVYVRNKEKGCADLGIYSEKYALPESTTQDELLALIDKLNNDNNIDGILCQLPVPKHIDDKAIIAAISPDKDVDAFCVSNVGKVMIGEYSFAPCTPSGVMDLLSYSGISVRGKNCVVLGRSNIVGKPMAMLLLEQDGTVTICHSKTKNLKEICREADVIVAAIGRPNFVTGDMVKEGAVVTDVGIKRDENNKLCGDVCFAEVEPKASFITPVPGGVGPMTITILLKNTVQSALNRLEGKR